ncbi:hypothetical protein DFH06DRAFT_1338500 [Mycena polygramma]|nr:hypothetical protein DFH06DRAFT_1338500 [Mycena polygramma]
MSPSLIPTLTRTSSAHGPKSTRTAPTPTASKWTPLTRAEAHAIMQAERFPGRYPPPVLSEERRKIPQAELNRLSKKMGQQNMLRRTDHIRPVTETVVEPLPLQSAMRCPPMTPAGPSAADTLILRSCRRQSYTYTQRVHEPLW